VTCTLFSMATAEPSNRYHEDQ